LIRAGRRFSRERILKSVESVLKTRNINRLTPEAYEFITSYCGSAPHINISAWKRAHSDIRDFVDLFLKSNEYGVNLEKAVGEKSGTRELAVIGGIVELCRKHESDVFGALDLEERRESVKIANRLLRGTTSLKDILGGRSLSHYMTGTKNPNVRELVDELNRLMDRMYVEGIKELVRKYPKDAVVAGNYVNVKVRYVVQAIIAAEVSQLKRADREPM
jgi:hypothetical protein